MDCGLSLCNFPIKNAAVGCHFILQSIFLTQGSNLHPLNLLHWQADTLPLSHLGSQLAGIAFSVFTVTGMHSGSHRIALASLPVASVVSELLEARPCALLSLGGGRDSGRTWEMEEGGQCTIDGGA